MSKEFLKTGERLFRGECGFAAGATTPAMLPEEDLPEFVFAGRSNVGKSSLINALTGRKKLARASNTPGRTQQINFFDLGGRAYLVDLPGYGFAAASKQKSTAWTGLIRVYLKHRRVLRRVCLLVDSRHGFKDSDRGAMGYLQELDAPFCIVLTKCDKVKPSELAARVADMAEESGVEIYETSADTMKGIPELRGILAAQL